MSCNEDVSVERTIELPAPPEEVWDALPALFEDDGDRARVVEEREPPHRLTFWWTRLDGDDPPAYVEIELVSSAVGTLLHVRETRIDGAHLERTVLRARAYA
jgi:uncharacterized protein YndB with AHSA1/START domain